MRFSQQKDLLQTTAWFIAALILIEIMIHAAFSWTPLRDTQLRSYFWYGESQEAKMRTLVNTENLPENSILYAGWLNDESVHQEPYEADITVYGSSFSGNIATAMANLRPDLKVRFVGGPGAPLNHSYGMYEMDREVRTTRTGVIGVISENVVNVLSMNNGTLFSDGLMPYFYPRYDIVNGEIIKSAAPLINSPNELRQALAEGDQWERQLSILAEHDAAYSHALFSADIFDHSAIGRLVRRAISKRHESVYVDRIYDSRGFKRESYAVQVLEALMLRMAEDLEAEGATPVVVLFATRDYEDHLGELLSEVLNANDIAFVNSYDACPSTDLSSYIPDGHFTEECDRETAAMTLELINEALAER